MQRLIRLESRTVPYEKQAKEAVAQAEETITQLTSIKGRVKTLQTDTSDHTTRIASLTKNFNEADARNQGSQAETNAMLQRLVKRVNVLESKNRDSSDGNDVSDYYSAQDLGEALLARLRSGDELQASTVAQLKKAIGSSRAIEAPFVTSAAPMRFPDTPSTDQEPAPQIQKPAPKRKRPAEQEAPQKPAKRAKPLAKEAAAAPPSTASVQKSRPAPSHQQRASPRGKKALPASAPTSTTTSFAPDMVPDSSQPRRTSREAKPTKRANYMTWLEVKAARKSSSQ